MTAICFLFFLSISQALVLRVSGSANILATLTDWLTTYELLKPGGDLTYDVKSNAEAIGNITSGGAPYDFASIDSGNPSNDTWKNYPEYMLIPISVGTLVPQYNVYVNTSKTSLELSREIVAEIFTGNITRWNDSRILAYNNITSDQISNANITVIYRADAGGANAMFTNALASFSPYFRDHYYNKSSNNMFPASIVAKDPTRWIGVRGNLLINAQVLTTSNSIGYVNYVYVSRDTQSQKYARLTNIQGMTVPAEPVNVAALLVGVNFDSHGYAGYIADTGEENAWPFGAVQYLYINSRPKNCTQAREVVLFLRWVLTNDLARARLSVNGFAPLDRDTVQTHSLARLANITCDGEAMMKIRTHEDRSGPLFIVALIVACFFFILVIVLSTLHVHYFRSTPVNFVYSIVFVIGAFLCLSSPFLWLVVPRSTSICQARLWLTSIGLSTLLGTMFSRTSQLRDIYLLQKKNVDLIKAGVSVRATLIKLVVTECIVLGVNLLILTIWSAVDPYSAALRIDDNLNLIGSWYCTSNNISVWLSLQLVFLFFLIIFGVIVIYQTWSFQRKVLLAEMRWVLIALYNIVLNLVAMLPIITLGEINDSALALIFIISIDFSGGGMVCAFLLPRVLSKFEGSSFDEHKDKTVGISRKQTQGGDGFKKPTIKGHDSSHTEEHSTNHPDSHKPSSDPSSNKGIELHSLHATDTHTTPETDGKELDEESMVRAPKSTSEADSPDRHFITVPDHNQHYSDDDHDTTPIPSPSGHDPERGRHSESLPGHPLDNSFTSLTGHGVGGAGAAGSGGSSSARSSLSNSLPRRTATPPASTTQEGEMRLNAIDERDETARDEDASLMWQDNPIARNER